MFALLFAKLWLIQFTNNTHFYNCPLKLAKKLRIPETKNVENQAPLQTAVQQIIKFGVEIWLIFHSCNSTSFAVHESRIWSQRTVELHESSFCFKLASSFITSFEKVCKINKHLNLNTAHKGFEFTFQKGYLQLMNVWH